MSDVGIINVISDFANEELALPATLPQIANSWRVLVYPVEVQTKTNSGIYLPEDYAESVSNLLTVGLVTDIGDLAYKEKRFYCPDTNEHRPWCEVGDWVVFSRASFISSVQHQGKKFVLLLDDNVLYKVDNPQEVDPRYDFNQEEIMRLAADAKARYKARKNLAASKKE